MGGYTVQNQITTELLTINIVSLHPGLTTISTNKQAEGKHRLTSLYNLCAQNKMPPLIVALMFNWTHFTVGFRKQVEVYKEEWTEKGTSAAKSNTQSLTHPPTLIVGNTFVLRQKYSLCIVVTLQLGMGHVVLSRGKQVEKTKVLK